MFVFWMLIRTLLAVRVHRYTVSLFLFLLSKGIQEIIASTVNSGIIQLNHSCVVSLMSELSMNDNKLKLLIRSPNIRKHTNTNVSV